MSSSFRVEDDDFELSYFDTEVPETSWPSAVGDVFARNHAPQIMDSSLAIGYSARSEEVEVQQLEYFDLELHHNATVLGANHLDISTVSTALNCVNEHDESALDWHQVPSNPEDVCAIVKDDSAAQRFRQSYSSSYESEHSQNTLRGVHQQPNNGSQDPLDGLDDFRALLEAARNDEALHSFSRGRLEKRATPLVKARKVKLKRATSKSSQLMSLVQPVKRVPHNFHSKEIAECSMPRFPIEDLPVYTHDLLGVVPKYRAKNRLRSIIKRKPGTQDTDLMSSNVEILGGRVDKQTLAWLRANFEEQPGQIMRREFLYERYLEFCQMTGREAMNAACVGKVVRTVFQGLSTRRLGRRGGSKYHYVNLQVVTSSAFASMRQSIGNIQKTGRKTKKHKPPSAPWGDSMKRDCTELTLEESYGLPNTATARVWAKTPKKLEAVELDFVTSGLSDEERSRRNVIQLANNCLVDAYKHVDAFKAVPDELSDPSRWAGSLELSATTLIAKDISVKDVVRFLFCFRLHIGILGGLIVRLNFHCIPDLINNFWEHTEPSLQVSSSLVPKKFRKVLEIPCIQLFIKQILHQFYDRIFAFFLPTKYGPVPDHLRSVLRDVTGKLDKWMVKATFRLPIKVREIVISSAFGFGRMVELVLDLSASVEHLNHLEKQKANRSSFLTVLDNLLANGCLMSVNISADDRAGLIHLLTRLRELPDVRNMSEQWDTWVCAYLQQRFEFKTDAEPGQYSRVRFLRTLDGFGAAWIRLCAEIEGAVRFPGFSGTGPFFGVVRFLRDSISFLIEQEKVKLLGKSMISVNAEAVALTVRRLLPCSERLCDYTLEHYIQCGIPIALVTSQSQEFFQGVPEVAPWLGNIDADTDALDLPIVHPVVINDSQPEKAPLVVAIVPTSSDAELTKRPRRRMTHHSD